MNTDGSTSRRRALGRGLDALIPAPASAASNKQYFLCPIEKVIARRDQPRRRFDEEALDVRAWCIDLGVRAAHAAVIASGGRANLLADPAQRLLREAMLYTLTAQTPGLRAASLRRLAGRSGEVADVAAQPPHRPVSPPAR